MKTALVFIFALVLGASSVTFAQQWTALGAGLSGPNFEESVVDRVAEIDGKLYACGYFNMAGQESTWSVAYWDGSAWHGHGNGIDSTVGVLDILTFNGKVTAFVTWGGESLVYAWNGSGWDSLPSTGLGTANYFTDAEVHNGQLYLLQDADGVFRFNGSSWDKIATVEELGTPRTLASYKNELYIGCHEGLYKYNGSTVQPVWKPADVFGLKVVDNTLYVCGGYLGVMGADSSTGVAAFDGTTMTSLGKAFAVDTTEFTEYIKDVAKIGNRLIAGGDVHDDIFSESRILTYVNGSWSTLGVADNLVRSVTSIGNTAYIGGYFFNISGQPFSNVAAVTFPENEHAIRGHVFLDINNNCTNEPSDVSLAEHIVRATPGSYSTITQADGSYTLFVDNGTYNVTASPLDYATACPPGSVNVKDSGTGIDFGFKPIDDSARIQPYLYSSRNVAGRRSSMVIRVANEGGVPATSVSVRLELSNYLTLLSTSIPYEQVDDHVYLFKIDNIPMQQSELVLITDSVDNALGQYALSRVFAIAGSGRAQHKKEVLFTSSWGVDQISEEIVGPLDPNEKLVASKQEDHPYVMLDTITAGDTLTYQIHFQNVGTDTAHTVVVRDTISPFVDLSTFKTLASSHPYRVEVSGSNEIIWTFTDIDLPDSSENYLASMGGIRYRFMQAAGNTPGTTITNSAAIFFDLNAPVITNETVNIIALPSSVQTSDGLQGQLTIFPNPAGKSVIVDIPMAYSEDVSVAIYSILGQKVLSATTTLPTALNLEKLPKGMYRLQVLLHNGMMHTGTLIVN